MEYRSTLIVVQDLTRAKRFYCELLGMKVTADFGASVTLDDAVILQTAESWRRIVGRDLPATKESNSSELYFETEHFDTFLERLDAVSGVKTSTQCWNTRGANASSVSMIRTDTWWRWART